MAPALISIAVLTSIMGGYDQIAAPVPQDLDCEWLLVTDQPPEITGEHPWPWKVIEERRPHMHPRLAAKVAKCRPDLYTDADMTIWVDGHLRITHPGFVGWAVAGLGEGQIAQLRHPFHQRLTEEAALSARLAKYAGQPVREQVAHYLERGYPDGWGLWAGGLIVRQTLGVTVRLGERWLAEQVRWTYQDQLSEAPLLWELGLRPVDLPGPLLGHPKFELTPHRDGSL